MTRHSIPVPDLLPVLALHCSGGAPRQWDALKQRHGANRILVTPELNRPPVDASSAADFTLADEARPILREMDHLGAERFHLVGHSYGGTIALHIALHHPERVASLSLYEPSAFYLLPQMGEAGRSDAELIAQFSDALAAPWQAGRAEETARVFVAFWGGAQAWDRMSDKARAATIAYLPRLEFEYRATVNETAALGDYRTLKVPTLVMAGDAPGPNPARTAARALKRVLPRVDWQTVAGAGHLGPLTHAEPVAKRIGGHIARSERVGVTQSIRFEEIQE